MHIYIYCHNIQVGCIQVVCSFMKLWSNIYLSRHVQKLQKNNVRQCSRSHMHRWMAGWMTCNFTSFSRVFKKVWTGDLGVGACVESVNS